ncbi:hypothetical protein JW949_04335 [Candidatus Woesearchaeota archaeon]|nr:hypothetical protein [Candidatus Woesearchaeota archaeon]
MADIEEVKNSILKWHYGILIYDVENIKEIQDIRNKRMQFQKFTNFLYDKIGDKKENGSIETLLIVDFMNGQNRHLLTSYSDNENIINHILVLETSIIDYCKNNKSFIEMFKRNILPEDYELFQPVIIKNNEGKEGCRMDMVITGDYSRINDSLKKCYNEAKEIYTHSA